MADGRRRVGWMTRKRWFAAAALVAAAVVVGGVLVATQEDEPAAVRVAADGDAATTSTTAEPTTTAPAPSDPTSSTGPTTTVTALTTTASPSTTAATARRTIGGNEAQGWTLVLAERGDGSKCPEFRVSTFTSGPLLCGSGTASEAAVVGDLVTVDTPIGRAIVAIVEAHVESWALMPYLQQGSPVLRDPLPGRGGYAYAAGPMKGTWPNGASLFFGVGENVIARTRFAVVDGTVPPGQSLTSTTRPYGTWPQYRRAGTTGFYWGGNEEVGFYDGSGGRCLLYRRLGGDPEAMLFDVCAPKNETRPVAYAQLLPVPPEMRTGTSESRVLVILADGLNVASWRCEAPSEPRDCGKGTKGGGGGPGFGRESQILDDPSGSGRQVIGHFPSPMSLGTAKTVTIILSDASEREVGRVVLDTGA